MSKRSNQSKTGERARGDHRGVVGEGLRDGDAAVPRAVRVLEVDAAAHRRGRRRGWRGRSWSSSTRAALDVARGVARDVDGVGRGVGHDVDGHPDAVGEAVALGGDDLGLRLEDGERARSPGSSPRRPALRPGSRGRTGRSPSSASSPTRSRRPGSSASRMRSSLMAVPGSSARARAGAAIAGASAHDAEQRARGSTGSRSHRPPPLRLPRPRPRVCRRASAPRGVEGLVGEAHHRVRQARPPVLRHRWRTRRPRPRGRGRAPRRARSKRASHDDPRVPVAQRRAPRGARARARRPCR